MGFGTRKGCGAYFSGCSPAEMFCALTLFYYETTQIFREENDWLARSPSIAEHYGATVAVEGRLFPFLLFLCLAIVFHIRAHTDSKHDHTELRQYPEGLSTANHLYRAVRRVNFIGCFWTIVCMNSNHVVGGGEWREALGKTVKSSLEPTTYLFMERACGTLCLGVIPHLSRLSPAESAKEPQDKPPAVAARHSAAASR